MEKSIFKSSDEKTREQVLRVLNRIQSRRIKAYIWLIYEDWDWLAVLQWLQDNGLLKSNPKRPPLKAFERWLRENNVPQRHTHYSAYELSLAHRRIEGARYPWNEVKHDQGMIRRWRCLYKDLTKLFFEEVAE